VVKYLGSKRKLLPAIAEAVTSCTPTGEVLDVFSGTARVGHHLKGLGYRVHANDYLLAPYHFARTYVEADGLAHRQEVETHLTRLAAVEPAQDHWFAQRYAVESRYFTPENALKIAAIREAIEQSEGITKSILLTALIEAADRVDSTTGLQMAFLKSYASRALQPLSLRLPQMCAGTGSTAHHGDALDFVRGRSADLAYLDPPYNQHSYLGNYHIWETLALWDNPDVYGVARKRTDVRRRTSAWNRRRGIAPALDALLQDLDVRFVVLSFSDEGFLGADEIEERLAREGEVTRRTIPYPRYVGAKIGIHDQRGNKVGQVKSLQNEESIFVLDRRQKSPCSTRPAASQAAP